MTDLPPSYKDSGSSGYTNWATQLPAGPAPFQQRNATINDVPNAPPPTYNSGHDENPRLALNSLPARRSTLTTEVMRTTPRRTTNVARNIQFVQIFLFDCQNMVIFDNFQDIFRSTKLPVGNRNFLNYLLSSHKIFGTHRKNPVGPKSPKLYKPKHENKLVRIFILIWQLELWLCTFCDFWWCSSLRAGQRTHPCRGVVRLRFAHLALHENREKIEKCLKF